MDTAHFELIGVALPDGEDPLGLWDVTAPPPALESTSFSAQVASEPPTWRVTLPGDASAATAWLRQHHHALALAQGDLAQAESELRRFDLAGVAFSAAETEDEAATRRQFEGFVAQMQRMIAQYAYVETVFGVAVARSSVSWTGNFTTRWAVASPPAHIALHRQAVQTALGSRMALVRLAAIVVGGAVGLTVKTTIPGGSLLAIPAAWKFVRNVLEELRAAWPALQLPGN